MTTYTVEGWCRQTGAQKPLPLEQIQFYISDECHLQLEAAERELQQTHRREDFVDVDIDELDLQMPSGCGPLSDCRLRVYLGGVDNKRGQFHLVGHRAADHSLVYTNPILVDQLM